jgi:hypothetical protein
MGLPLVCFDHCKRYQTQQWPAELATRPFVPAKCPAALGPRTFERVRLVDMRKVASFITNPRPFSVHRFPGAIPDMLSSGHGGLQMRVRGDALNAILPRILRTVRCNTSCLSYDFLDIWK